MTSKVAEERLKRKSKRKEKRSGDSDFLCSLQFVNKLPDLPYEPKFLQCPLDDHRYSQYKPTTLEQDYKYELLTGIDVGVSLDLIDISSFLVLPNPPPMDPVDKQLIDGESKSTSKANAPSFLLHPQYLSTDSGAELRVAASGATSAATATVTQSYYKDIRGGVGGAGSAEDAEDKAKMINNIKESFEEARLPPKHPNNPKLEPVQVWQILPDEELWGNEYSEVVFDTDPVSEEDEDISQKRQSAIIKSVSIPNQDLTCLRYFTKRRRLNDEEEEQQEDESEYSWVREYKYRLHKGEGDNFLLLMKENNEVTYTEIKTKVIMQKVTTEFALNRPTRVVVRKLPVLSTTAQQQLDNARQVLKEKWESRRDPHAKE